MTEYFIDKGKTTDGFYLYAGKSVETREYGSTTKYTKWYPTYDDFIYNHPEYKGAPLKLFDLSWPSKTLNE